MINVNVFNINDPWRAKLTQQMTRQAIKYESLQGGVHAMMGNTWDPWNVLGISWQIYNDLKSVGKTDEEIAKYVEENKDDSEIKQIRARVKHYKEMM